MELFKIFGTLAVKGVQDTKKDLSDVSSEAQKTAGSVSSSLGKIGKNVTDTFKNSSPNELGEKLKGLSNTISAQEGKLNSLKNRYKELYVTQGENSKEAQECAKEIEDLSKELNTNKKRLNEAQDASDKFDKQLKDTGNQADKTSSKLSKLGSVCKSIGKGLLLATGAVATGAVALVKNVSSSYGRLQQSIGGIETLFKDSAQKVIENANNAYTTAGIDANSYMEQVTSFSASLLQALDGDTAKACDSADMAIRDMADNANKMGTHMEDIQNAYQGFSKQNYTMLDNLKLGYGGTKTEMERLLADAEKLTGIKYDISNLNDVYQAIHVIQQDLGITGTTAQEAGETIEGSFNSLSASWQNFLAGLGNPEADMKKLVENLAKGISGAITNVIPVINNMVAVLPTVMDALVDAISQMLPTLIETFTELITKVIDAIVKLLPEFIPLAIDCVLTVAQTLIENLPLIIDAGVQLITGLAQGLIDALPTLIPVIVDVVMKIADTILDNLGLIINVALQLILALAQGIIDALPTLIDYIPKIVDSIIMTIADNLPLVIETGVKIIIALAEGLIKAIPHFIQAIPQIIASLVKGLIDGVTEMFNAGSRLMSGVLGGIKSKFSDIVSFFKNNWKTIVSFIVNPFGTAVKLIAENFDSIKNFFGNIVDKIKNLWSNFCDWFKSVFKLPHFTSEGSWNPKDWFSQGLPRIGVEWYAEGAVLNKPTAFGYNPATGNAMVGGEAGAEAITPISTLQKYISDAVQSENSNMIYYVDKLIDLLSTYLPDIRDSMDRPLVLDSGQLVNGIASKMDAKLGDLATAKGRFRG